MDESLGITNPVLQKLHTEADSIQLYLKEPANLQDPTSLTIRLNALDTYLARLGEILVFTKALKERAQNNYLADNENRLNKLTATASNRQINAFLYEYKVTCDRFDTLYSLCQHLSRDLVTQISYIKKQMETFGG